MKKSACQEEVQHYSIELLGIPCFSKNMIESSKYAFKSSINTISGL